ncbi:hypothetical protein Salat_2997200 [Sesamum alatum]|uniref:Uncharacterized protein n=1 Tax=Sesamum alatum TaxID=300844 RepID=A0AAE1XHC5_9LAMI|nr:hypothetical protein Salat_2997200 [Sesamum alatum]
MSPISRDESHLRPSDFLRLEPIQERLKPLHNRMQGNHVREKRKDLTARMCPASRDRAAMPRDPLLAKHCGVSPSRSRFLSSLACSSHALSRFPPWSLHPGPFH